MSNRSTARRESVNQSLMSKSGEKQVKTNEKEHNKTPKKNDVVKTPENNKVQKQSQQSQATDFDNFKEEIRSFFEKYDQTLDKKLTQFDDKFTNLFEELKKEIGSMRSEVYEGKSKMKELSSRMDEVEKSLEFQAQDIEEREDRQSNLLYKQIKQLEDLQKKLLAQEKHDRRYNLLFYGFQESPKEDLEPMMKQFFKSKLEIPEETVESMIFANLHRFPSEATGPKPIIIKFVCMANREVVYSKSLHPVLRDERKRILSDLPLSMKIERGKLAKAAYKIRKNQKKQTRIVERGMSLELEVRKEKGKPWKKYEENMVESEEEETEEVQ